MKYYKYKNKLNKEEYFKNWNCIHIHKISEERKTVVYNKYILKCVVYARDNYKCQNAECVTPNDPITIHHIKAKRNNGADKPRNCVTICNSCHVRYERNKGNLVFSKDSTVSPHLRGQTFKPNDIKQIVNKQYNKANSKTIRKNVKNELGSTIDAPFDGRRVWYIISWERVALLMKWLQVPFDEWDIVESPVV